MAFSINLISVDGYFVGPCKPMASMDNATIEGAPQESTVELGQFSFARSGYDLGPMEWNNYYLPACSQYGAMSSMVDFWDYLEVNHYSVNNPLLVCAFKLVDGQGTETGVQLCLMAYSSSSNGNVTWQMKKRTLSQGTWTYTNISPTRTDNIYNMTGFGMMSGTVVVNGKLWYAFGFATLYADYQARAVLFGNTTQGLTQVLGGTVPGETESPEFGPAAKPGGGYIPGGGAIPGGGTTKEPTFDNTSDKIEISSKPYMNPFRSGFINGYYVTPTQLAHFADAIFPPPPQSGSDIPNMIWNIATQLFNNKRVDYILDFLIVPVEPAYLSAVDITCGGQPLMWQQGGVYQFVQGNPIEDSIVDFSCGSISIDEYWVNFLDFSGTKVKLFLPYVGYVDIQPEFVIGGTLYVDYRFNVFDGSFMAYVRSDSGYSQLEESLIGQYAGVAAMHLPLQSQDYSNKISGLISAVGTVAAAGVGGVTAAGAASATASLANTVVQKPGSVHANGYNASSSYLSNRTPYLIIERQWSQFSEKYPEEVGMPSNVMCRIGALNGLVKSANAHLDVIPCSVEGKEKISQLLSEGIIV